MLVPPSQLIVPGESLGHIRIGAPVATLARLGPAGAGDAAMMKSWTTWLGKSGARLDVFTSIVPGRQSEKHVLEIRATSPYFRTDAGLHPGSSERAWRKGYPQAKDLQQYRPPSGGPPIHIFDDARRGIAFEVQKGRCVAVTIHRKGEATGSLIAYVREPLQRVR